MNVTALQDPKAFEEEWCDARRDEFNALYASLPDDTT
jgi:hypothetical protein